MPVTTFLLTAGTGGWGGGPRFILKLASVATGIEGAAVTLLVVTVVVVVVELCCFFCFFNVKCFCSSALKSNAGPFDVLVQFEFGSVCSPGGDRFGVILLPIFFFFFVVGTFTF